jgi:hypothetical protein
MVKNRIKSEAISLVYFYICTGFWILFYN